MITVGRCGQLWKTHSRNDLAPGNPLGLNRVWLRRVARMQKLFHIDAMSFWAEKPAETLKHCGVLILP